MKDGIVLFYCKDDVLYPVALSEEQLDTLQFTVSLVCNPLKVVFDQPQGPVVNLNKPKEDKTDE